MNNIIIGVDEVGRGPLAGPVVACNLLFLLKIFKLISLMIQKNLLPKKEKKFFKK